MLRISNRRDSTGHLRQLHSTTDAYLYRRKPLYPSTLEAGYPLNNGMIACWLFNEGLGTNAFDISGNNYTAALTNGPTWSTQDGRTGILFDGGNDYLLTTITPTNFPVTSAHTIFAIFRPQDNSASIYSYQAVVYMGNSAALSPNFHFDGVEVPNKTATVVRYAQYDGTEASADNTITPSAWVSIGGVHDGTNLNLYQDGAFIESIAKRTPTIHGSARLRIASALNEGYMKGHIETIRLYTRALSAAEIASLHADPYQGITDATF